MKIATGSRGALAWTESARRIAPLAWPVFVGQVSVLAFATADTLLVARASAQDLAALAVGSAAYVSVFIGCMGVVMALAPIVGQLYGAQRLREAGHHVHQALWLALALSLLGSTVLAFPQPFIALARTSPEVAAKVRGYMLALAFSLPASLLFTVYRAFNTAVGRPKPVMQLQLTGLALKVPLSAALVFGVPALGLPALGVLGCGVATAVSMWSQVLGAAWRVRRETFYLPFGIVDAGLRWPDRDLLRQHLRLGLPMGASILVEVTGFSFMAIFISRLGTTPVAGHQIAVNLVSLLFMVPLALGNATGTLVAIGVGAGRARDASRLAGHGMAIGCGLAAAMGTVVYAAREPVLRLYTQDPSVLAAALPLVAWLVLFHFGDAAQTIAAFVLRAYKIAVVPMVIYVGALWGVGLGGGYLLAFGDAARVPASLRGAPGFWFAATIGLMLAAASLASFMVWMLRRQRGATP